MDAMEVNKTVAAVLVGGIVFMVSGLVSEMVVRPQRLPQPAIRIEVAAPAAEGAPKPEEPLAPIGELLAKADPAAGEATARKLCAVCHTFNDGGPAGVGPNLYGVVMGPHAHMPGFSYSAGMQGLKDKTWDYEALNQWLKKPAAVVPGTRMAFAGIASDRQRADVIAYLRSLAKDPAPLPAP